MLELFQRAVNNIVYSFLQGFGQELASLHAEFLSTLLFRVSSET